MNTFEEHMRNERQNEYNAFCSRMERVLDRKVHNDLIDSGKYLDDDIGEADFIDAIDAVKDSLYKTLWDCYEDNIGTIINEEA